MRTVLAIRPYRRLLASCYLCSVGDWLGFLALSGLASRLLHGYFAQNFAFAGVVLTNLLPGLVFAPIGGVLADRFDRRTVMILTDLARCALFVSIPFVGTVWWLFGANFLVGCMAMLWVPAKDAGVPNLMRGPGQIETANQVGLVVTYGAAVLTGAGCYALITGVVSTLRLQLSTMQITSVLVLCTGLCYAASALVIATRIPELSGRSGRHEPGTGAGFFRLLRGGMRVASGTPLIRGLLLGMVGAFAAAGAVIGTARQYAHSLLAGESALGMLFVTLFCGLATGMIAAPRIARRMAHNRLFGVAIVAAGVALALCAVSPHLVMSLVTVYVLGAAAGVAFLTGITIIGSQVEDAVRGRVNAVYQSLMKVMLFASTVLAPLLVGLTRQHRMDLFGRHVLMDGTRPVLAGAGVLAVLFGVVAYRQMGDRSTESILANLVRLVHGRGRRTGGLLLAVEGVAAVQQAERLAERLRGGGIDAVLACPTPVNHAGPHGERAQVLLAAAARAELAEYEIRPALERGAVVVAACLTDHDGGAGARELVMLTDWATDRLRPDITVVLEAAAPQPDIGTRQRWQVSETVAGIAADPDRYLVVDADQDPETATTEITTRLAGLLDTNGSGAGSEEPVTGTPTGRGAATRRSQ